MNRHRRCTRDGGPLDATRHRRGVIIITENHEKQSLVLDGHSRVGWSPDPNVIFIKCCGGGEVGNKVLSPWGVQESHLLSEILPEVRFEAWTYVGM